MLCFSISHFPGNSLSSRIWPLVVGDAWNSALPLPQVHFPINLLHPFILVQSKLWSYLKWDAHNHLHRWKIRRVSDFGRYFRELFIWGTASIMSGGFFNKCLIHGLKMLTLWDYNGLLFMKTKGKSYRKLFTLFEMATTKKIQPFLLQMLSFTDIFPKKWEESKFSHLFCSNTFKPRNID